MSTTISHTLPGRIRHHGKKHLTAFHVKHNVSGLTLMLLIVFSLVMNILYVTGMNSGVEATAEVLMTHGGSTLPLIVNFLSSFF